MKQLRDSLGKTKPTISFKTLAKLTIILQRFEYKKFKMALDIKTAAKLSLLIPAYDGNPSGRKSFLDAVGLVQQIVPPAQQNAALQLILSKLTGKARDLFSETPENFNTITNKIKDNCVDKTTSDNISNKLKHIKVKPDLSDTTKEIEDLCSKLTESYIREEIPENVARTMSKKAGVQALIKNSKKSETQMMLKVGKFENISEAINLVLENEDDQPSASIFRASAARNNNNNNNNIRPSISPSRYYYNRNRFGYRNNQQHRNYNNNFNNNNNNNFNRNNNRFRGNNRVFRGNFNRFPNQRARGNQQIFLANSNEQMQQQAPVATNAYEQASLQPQLVMHQQPGQILQASPTQQIRQTPSNFGQQNFLGNIQQ